MERMASSSDLVSCRKTSVNLIDKIVADGLREEEWILTRRYRQIDDVHVP